MEARLNPILLLLCFLAIGLSTRANATFPAPLPDKAPLSVFDQLHRSPLMRVTLELDLPQLLDDRNTRNTQTAILHEGQNHYEVEIEVRGRYRRRICEVPPLKLKFDKKGLRAGGLNEHNDLKLVTHCSADKFGNEYLLREQLAYELYNLITPQSFRTQLLEITYLDRTTGQTETHMGILIEDVDEMAERLGGAECDDCYGLTHEQFQARNTEQLALFQYMIGNTDWSFMQQRNVKMIRLAEQEEFLAVPYDFDFAGLVNAKYAVPDASLGQRSIKERVWLWKFEEPARLTMAFQHFLTKKTQMLAHVESFELLSKGSRREISRYLNDFFEELEQGGLAQR